MASKVHVAPKRASVERLRERAFIGGRFVGGIAGVAVASGFGVPRGPDAVVGKNPDRPLAASFPLSEVLR